MMGYSKEHRSVYVIERQVDREGGPRGFTLLADTDEGAFTFGALLRRRAMEAQANDSYRAPIADIFYYDGKSSCRVARVPLNILRDEVHRVLLSGNKGNEPLVATPVTEVHMELLLTHDGLLGGGIDRSTGRVIPRYLPLHPTYAEEHRAKTGQTVTAYAVQFELYGNREDRPALFTTHRHDQLGMVDDAGMFRGVVTQLDQYHQEREADTIGVGHHLRDARTISAIALNPDIFSAD